jgi:hypothetical protein
MLLFIVVQLCTYQKKKLFNYVDFLFLLFGIDGHEIVCDVESDDKKYKCEYMLIDGDENVEEPKRGVTFSSIEELSLYYRRYAKQEGFAVVRKKASKDPSGCINRITLACSREGNTKTKSTFCKPNQTIKTGCKAKLNSKLVETKWYVTSVCIDHNHDLSPGQARYFKCNKILDPILKRKLEENDFINKARHLRLDEGGAKALCDYFSRMQEVNDGFYHMMDFDDESKLKNVFWADARSMASYEYFGDVVTFDTTYLTNKYKMPFALFLGVNHHGQSMLFGAGLLSSEDTETFVWLFETFLICMNGRAPSAIITYQDKSMKNAIARVFPRARHRFCLWHILKKLIEKFGAHSQCDAIKSALQSCVYDSQTCDEFETSWQSLLESYNLEDNAWLRELYHERTFWVPAYVKDVFWAKMTTTQQSESMKAFFDGYVYPSTTWKEFVDQYDNALRKKVEDENAADFSSLNSTIPCISLFPFEKKFQQVYTNSKFKEVQEEIRMKLYCTVSLLTNASAICTYQVTEQVGVNDAYMKQVRFCVYFNENECEVKCTCGCFESRGILCRHAISVLSAYNVTQLPQKYILDRWRKDLNRRYTFVKSSYGSLSDNHIAQRYDNLCKSMHKLAAIAATNVDHYTKVKNHIHMLLEKLNGLSFEPSLPSHALPGASSTCNESIDGVAVESNKVRSPLVVHDNGKPSLKRKVSLAEKVVVTKSHGRKNQPSDTNPKQKRRQNQVAYFSFPCVQIMLIKNMGRFLNFLHAFL